MLSFALALLILIAAGVVRADPILIDGRNRVDLAFDGVLSDPTSRRTVTDVRDDPAAFASSTPWSGRVSLGFTADAVWLRSEILVPPAAAGRYVLMLDIPNFERLEMWGSWTQAPVAVMGDLVTEATSARRHAESFDLPAGRHTLWFRAVTSGPVAVPLALWRPDAFTVAEQREIHFHTILTTVAALLGLGALPLAAVMPSPAMVLYAGSALASTGHIMAMNGLDNLMWGGHLPVGTNNPFVWLVGSGVFGIAFLFSMLPLRRTRWMLPVVGAPVVLGLVLLVIYNFLLEEDSWLDVLVRPRNLALLILAAGVAASVQSRLSGHRPASYMILGWLTLVAGNVVAALRNTGFLPFTEVTYFLPVYAPVVEMLFFAVMMAAQLRLLRVENDEAQRALVVALRRNEAELAERVGTRTADLDRANALLAAREAQLRLILEAAPMPIVVFQAADSTPLYSNRRMRDLLVGSSGEAGAVPDIRTIYQNPDDGDRLAATLEHDGFVENAEVAMRDVAGNHFWALASMVAIDYQGRPALLLALNDISRRRQLEQELVKAKEMAEAAAGLERAARDAQRQFLAMISHEFRTPLAVISTATQYLQLEAEKDPAREPRLARIRRAVGHMNGMIDACLLDDRIEGAGLLLRTSPLDPVVLVRRAADAAQAAAPQHAFVTIAEETPSTAGDEQLLGMALSNLMENAVKYSPPGSAVEVTLTRSGNDAVVTVADRGPGVPGEECGRVFEKYYRGTNTGRVPGAGLGLYLTHHIVTAHGGTVGVRNRPDGGAVFTVRLQLQCGIETEYGAVPVSEAGPDGPAWNGAA